MSNPAKLLSRLYQGSIPRGSVEEAYPALVLQLLNALNAAPTSDDPVVDVTNQLFDLVGRDDLAARDMAARLSYLRR
jgi:hypothetical protein